jgi:hypothetical protein
MQTVQRKEFLGSLVVLGAALAMTACGGGGGNEALSEANGSVPSKDVVAPVADDSAPSTPDTVVAALTATASGAARIELGWSAPEGDAPASRYEIARCEGAGCAGFALVAETDGTDFSDAGLRAATAYTYRVTAFDETGRTLSQQTVQARTSDAALDGMAPAAPTALRANPLSASQVELTWTAATDNVGVTGYRVERCVDGACQEAVQVQGSVGQAITLSGLNPSTAYTFRVRAVDEEGNLSPASDSVSFTTSAKPPAEFVPPSDGTLPVEPDAAGSMTPSALAANASVAGTITTPFPTMQNLSVQWTFTGDANANASVKVRYRARGETTWRTGMPLRRVTAGSSSGFSWTTRHSGSVFDLKPATTYELELSLTDVDGGSVVRTVTATTRAVPTAMAAAPVKSATPSNLTSVLGSAVPGDIIQLAAGTYPAFTMLKDGAAGKPIVIRGTSGVVINGEVMLQNRKHVILQSVLVNGTVRFDKSSHVAIVRNTIKTKSTIRSGSGVVAYLRAENAYIADNVITGPTVWANSSLGVNGNNIGEGVQFTGPGHVVMNNKITGFRDNISLMEGSEAVDQYSIDILNNDMSVAADDAVEADFCFHNCRVMRNRVTNAFIGMSSQPSLGGPTYFIRNVMYNIAHVSFKLYRNSSGDVLLHNTVVKGGDALGVYAGTPINKLLSRNNLFIGGPGGSYGGYDNGSGKALQIPDLVTSTADMNYDALGSTTGTFSGRLGSTSFSSLATLRSSTSQKNAIQVSLGVFNTAVAMPSNAMSIYAAPDLRLLAGSSAVDKGVSIPGVNSGFLGSAPDMGAYESGATKPVVGPR